jgi:PIN domain nuclease of toxin-antitoxin system
LRVLLDTQALVLAHQGLLPAKIQQFLTPVDLEVCLSSASLTEIAIKFAIGKLEMTELETRQALSDLRITPLAFEPRHALAMFSLPLHHRDPFDRMILATALVEKLPIITSDRSFRRYPGVKIIW